MPTLVVDGRRWCALSTWKSNLSHTACAIRTVICLATLPPCGVCGGRLLAGHTTDFTHRNMYRRSCRRFTAIYAQSMGTRSSATAEIARDTDVGAHSLGL